MDLNETTPTLLHICWKCETCRKTGEYDWQLLGACSSNTACEAHNRRERRLVEAQHGPTDAHLILCHATRR